MSSWGGTGPKPTVSLSRRRRRLRDEDDERRATIALTPVDHVGHAVRAAADKKASNVVVLDVQELLGITDYFVICSGSSVRQVRTIADEIVRRMKDKGLSPIRREGEREAGWVLIDYEDFVVHVFGEEEREFYDLERLWKDAPRVHLLGAEEATG
jgi:ribosome-associated protein